MAVNLLNRGIFMTDIKIIDLHTHTDSSQDGNHPVDFMAQTAADNGIQTVAFTDHCEVDVLFSAGFDKRVERSFKEVSRAKKEFEGKIEILRGIELAEAHYEPALSENILATHNYDVVIGSLHNLRNQPDFYDFETFDGLDVVALMNEYFDEILGLLQWGNFDILAHITYPFRYIYNHLGYVEDINKYAAKVDEILKLCAEKGKALEINMGGLKYPINLPSPNIDTVKRYRELGGELISVGSDSHYAERIGFGIPNAYEIAREAGFKSVAIFRERKVFEHPIV